VDVSVSRISRHLPCWRTFATYSVISMAIGLLIILLLGVGSPGFYNVPTFVGGMVLGFFINLGAFTAEVLLFAALGIDESWTRGVRRSLGLLSYFVGGAAGYIFGSWLIAVLVSGLTDGEVSWVSAEGPGISILVFGLLALVIGLVFNIVSFLREQLEKSVARIKEQEFAEKELETARALQRRLLPPARMEGRGWVVEARYLPATRVAGDFYDVFSLPDGGLGLVVGDVVGKGMAASLLVASVKAMLPVLAVDRSVAETLREVNRRLERDLGPREFVALAFARFDPARGSLELANAGLPDPYRIASSPRPLEVDGPRLPLGLRSEVDYQSSDYRLEEGERLLLVTDGMPEAPGADGSPLGYESFAELLSASSGGPGEWLDGLVDALRARTEPPQEDDWTALLLERGSASDCEA
jgi:serine phosphatase RsbU (regulator of sigma subunit)